MSVIANVGDDEQNKHITFLYSGKKSIGLAESF
jgi:hypothetical protein